MATNEILPFASTNTGTNLLTQSEYAADAQRTTGNQPGIARSKLVNKALRQSSLIAAGLAEFIADYQSNNVNDSLTPQDVADYLYAAINAIISFPTPPIFDNDTSVATTAFVQRALGNFRGIHSVSMNATLTQDDIGKVIYVSSENGIITLPSTSGIPEGCGITIINTNRGAPKYFTLAAAAGDVVALAGNNFPSILVRGGENITLTSSGGAWSAVTGQATLGNWGNFAASLVTRNSGWQLLPSGLIMQWLYGPGPRSGGEVYNLPITFPNGPIVGFAQVYQSIAYSQLELWSNSQVKLQNNIADQSTMVVVLGW